MNETEHIKPSNSQRAIMIIAVAVASFATGYIAGDRQHLKKTRQLELIRFLGNLSLADKLEIIVINKDRLNEAICAVTEDGGDEDSTDGNSITDRDSTNYNEEFQ